MPQARGGTPGPDRWILHEAVTGPGKAVPNVVPLHAGATATNGVPMACLVTCAGAGRGRVRFRATVPGTLKLEFARPYENNFSVEVYTQQQPPSVPVAANTEAVLTTNDIAGEASAVITFTPSANGTVNFCDWMAL